MIFDTKKDNRDPNLGNGTPGNGNVRVFAVIDFRYAPDVFDILAHFKKGYLSWDKWAGESQKAFERRILSNKVTLMTSAGQFFPTVQCINMIKDAVAQARMCNMRHVAICDGRAIVLIWFPYMQLRSGTEPYHTCKTEVAGLSCALAVLDLKTDSTSVMLCTILGFMLEALKSLPRED